MTKKDEEGETSIIQTATTTSKSLRATIPQGIVKQFGLEEGQTLYWKIKVLDGQMVVVVKCAVANKSNSKVRQHGTD